MSTSIYRPYFYIIQHINSGKYYSGVKYAENSNPDTFLQPNGYQTSSHVVKQIIFEEGLESFIIRKIKIFETGEEALDYESRFLRRVNASFNESFLNRSNNSIGSLNVDSEKRKQTCLDNLGYEYPMQSKEVREKSKQTCLENYGVENPSQSSKIQEKKRQTFLENYGVENPFQSEEIKNKIKKTNLEKYGVENPGQSPEIQEKKRHNRIAIKNRPTVLEIMRYKEKFNPKLPYYWHHKKQDILDGILDQLKIIYGKLD